MSHADHFNLRDVDAGVVVADEVDVGGGQVLADDLPPGVAWLIVPLVDAVLEQEGGAGLGAEAVGLNPAVGLSGGPVVELEKYIGYTQRNLLFWRIDLPLRIFGDW